MSTSITTLAPRPSRASLRAAMSKREQSRVILTATAGAICTILFVWLLATTRIKAPAQSGPLWAMSLPFPEALGGIVAFANDDAKSLSRGELPAFTASDTPKARLERDLGKFLQSRKGRPVIVYLAAAAGPWGNSSEARTVLFSDGDAQGEVAARVAIEDLVTILKERGEGSNKLLILDAGLVGPDRQLGLFGSDLPARLEKLIERDRSLAVLLSCDAGQMSWVAEGAGTSVFAHYLAEALDGRLNSFGGATAGDLLEYIRPRVQRWVRENRGNAVQTPVLIGPPGLRLALPRSLSGLPDKVEVAAADPKFRKELLAEWGERQRMASQPVPPSRHAAVAWRRYQAELLRAERLARCTSRAAEVALRIAKDERARVEAQVAGLPLPRPWSLAVARATRSSLLRVDPDAYEKSVAEMLRQLGAGAGPGAVKKDDEDEQGAPKAGDPKAAAPEAKANAAAKDEKANAAAKVEKGAPAAKEEKKAEATANGGGDPLETLTDGAAASGMPLFVEGQLPVWYAQFARRGGESPELRDDRVKLVSQAFVVRSLAETACADPRVAPWIRPMVDKADAIRRKGQDLIFSADAAGLEKAKAELDQAAGLYREAASAAEGCAKALDLIGRLQDELPYDGDWLARRGVGLPSEFVALLDQVGPLADVAYAPPDDPRAVDESRAKLLTAAANLDRAARKYRGWADQQITRLAESEDWRELDALLCLPTLDPARRDAILTRVSSSKLSPAFDSEAGEESGSKPSLDAAFWNRAVGLARVEVTLLKLGGFDDPALLSQVKEIETTWSKSPETALTSLESLSGRVQSARRQLIQLVNGRDEVALKPSESARAIRLADRAARVLPVASMARADDPTEAKERIDRRDAMVSEAIRLCEDLAIREARQLLDEARSSGSADDAEAVRKAVALAGERAAARLVVNVDKPGVGSAPVKIVQSGELPDGLAAAFVPNTPEAGGSGVIVRANKDADLPAPNLLAVPEAQPAPLSFERNGRQVGFLTPVVFYRGRFFRPRGDQLALGNQMPVTVNIEQRYLDAKIKYGRGKIASYKMRDQFVQNGGRGYLHPVNPLSYRLRVRNPTDQSLQLWVSHGLEGLAPYGEAIEIPPRRSAEVFGSVSPNDLPDKEVERMLTVRITDQDAEGRLLAKELKVPFTKIAPKESDVAIVDGYDNGVMILKVMHSGSDRVTSPMRVSIKVEPVNEIRQEDAFGEFAMIAPENDDRGTAYFLYRLRDRTIKALEYTLTADGVTMPKKEMKIDLAPDVPKAPPAAAAPPAGAPPAAPGG